MTGLDRGEVRRVGQLLCAAGTALVEHDLTGVGAGVVTRRLSVGAPTARELDDPDAAVLHGAWTVLELQHACVSCTLREDLLPLLMRLGRDRTLRRIVVLVDPTVEPESVSEALRRVTPPGEQGSVLEVVDLRAVVAVIDSREWLRTAVTDTTLAERGLALSPDDRRSIAQISIGQVEFADLVLLSGLCSQSWERLRLEAVLARLAPRARRAALSESATAAEVGALLDDLPSTARRGRSDDPDEAVLRGQPPLESDAGVALLHVEERRPFHPERLREAFDVLVNGTVRVRGRLWVATRPEVALWVESAGGRLGIGVVGRWLAASEPEAWDRAGPVRRAEAAVQWDERFGDREQQLTILAHDADPAALRAVVRGALLTDEELGQGEAAWRRWEDPFDPVLRHQRGSRT